MWNFQSYRFSSMKTNIYWDFQICISAPLNKNFYLITQCLLFKSFYFGSSHRRCSIKKAVLKNFTIFAGKHLRWSVFLTMLQAWRHSCFPVKLTKYWRTTILKKHLWSAASVTFSYANFCFFEKNPLIRRIKESLITRLLETHYFIQFGVCCSETFTET